MFERFDELAKRAVVAAQDAVLSMGHDFIGTGHRAPHARRGAGTLRESVLGRMTQQAA